MKKVLRSKFMKIFLSITFVFNAVFLPSCGLTSSKEPVIYLYPTVTTDVTVKVQLDGKLQNTYPQYNGGWDVIAQPNGTLTNKADGRKYSYLFWDGMIKNNFDFSSGYVVKGSDTIGFLQEKLAYLGLTDSEANEFIVYWLPKMQRNAYNEIAFQTTAFTSVCSLDITPKPDCQLIIYMAFKPIKRAISLPPQQLKTFTRSGFTVVEWGGSEV